MTEHSPEWYRMQAEMMRNDAKLKQNSRFLWAIVVFLFLAGLSLAFIR